MIYMVMEIVLCIIIENKLLMIKNHFFLNVAQIRTILSLLAYAPPTLATIFDFELAQKKVVSDPPEVHLNVSK